ncbi:protein FAM124A isoform X2 [Bufo bufo]|uniref:protein FAM124A isoform X2 n=1 Tax=Bufo bufo TaxID=8384 RepID=UPI001ABDDF27|nr:protein FAM124A isoform X2 [Bufo bufo]
MEKTGEDDCEDSGAETGGSDYSRMSSTSSELSVDDVQDPFLVSIHIIADPSESRCLQGAIDRVLALIHPDLQLFRVSERRTSKKKKLKPSFTSQPALAIILFLQEEYGEDQILRVHKCFQKPPWQFHHTERVHGKFLPYMPCNQDFFTLACGTPLWAIRQVHYGKEIIRFTIYCSYENFTDMMKMYELVLKKSVWKKKADFCVFPIYSNMDIEIELSLKRLLKGQTPLPLESSLLEFRVKDFGQLVPLLPNQCSPISEGRWQTEDHDGNKILLQVHRLTRKSVWKHQRYLSRNSAGTAPFISMIPHTHKKKYDKNLTHLSNGTVPGLRTSDQNCSKTPADFTPSSNGMPQWFQRSKSLVCLPTLNSFPSCESFPFSEPPHFYQHDPQGLHSSVWRSSPRINIDDLEGVQETDVDTGMKLSSSDLSVVSAYSPLDGLSSDLQASLPSPGELHFEKSSSRNKLCELSYESFNSVSERSSCSLVSSVFPSSLGCNSLTESQKDIESHYLNNIEATKHPEKEETFEEEEFYI